jgi:hypothetical protein
VGRRGRLARTQFDLRHRVVRCGRLRICPAAPPRQQRHHDDQNEAHPCEDPHAPQPVPPRRLLGLKDRRGRDRFGRADHRCRYRGRRKKHSGLFRQRTGCLFGCDPETRRQFQMGLEIVLIAEGHHGRQHDRFPRDLIGHTARDQSGPDLRELVGISDRTIDARIVIGQLTAPDDDGVHFAARPSAGDLPQEGRQPVEKLRRGHSRTRMRNAHICLRPLQPLTIAPPRGRPRSPNRPCSPNERPSPRRNRCGGFGRRGGSHRSRPNDLSKPET